MNTLIEAGKAILNALAFANADNYSEFRILLNQTCGDNDIDSRHGQSGLPDGYKKDMPSVTPPGHRIRQAV